MTLGEKQRQFTLMVAKLIIHAYDIGYELTLGEGYDDDGTGHAKGSTHYVRLGQDLNIFKNGVWLQDGTGHAELHDFWDKIGGSPRIAKDLNHYSLEWNGVR
ncbi:MAG: M15 family peptidase [Clostridia bacterium]|jgi:hypothetical protein